MSEPLFDGGFMSSKQTAWRVPNGEIQDMAERLYYYVDEIRKRRDMDAETEKEEP